MAPTAGVISGQSVLLHRIRSHSQGFTIFLRRFGSFQLPSSQQFFSSSTDEGSWELQKWIIVSPGYVVWANCTHRWSSQPLSPLQNPSCSYGNCSCHGANLRATHKGRVHMHLQWTPIVMSLTPGLMGTDAFPPIFWTLPSVLMTRFFPFAPGSPPTVHCSNSYSTTYQE